MVANDRGSTAIDSVYKNENDFDNYGIKILVKYRDHEVLQVTNNQFIYDTA